MIQEIPHNDDAELSLIGSCLLDSRHIDDAAVIVRPEMFYQAACRNVWNAMLQLQNANKFIDVVTVAHKMEENQTLNVDGSDVGFLGRAMETVPVASHWKYYADIIQGHWLRREGLYAAQAMQQAIADKTITAAESISKLEKSLTNLIESTNGNRDCQSISEVLLDVFDQIGEPREDGLKCGISALDEITDGFRPNELIILAARPSVGKTALCLNFIQSWCKGGASVLLASAEQSKLEIAERMLSLNACVSMHDLRQGNVDELSLGASSNAMAAWKLVIDDQANPSILHVESVSRMYRRKTSIDAIVIDYLQLIEPSDARLPREQQVASITKKLKGLAKTLSVPVIVLAQLNRSVESRGSEGSEDFGRPRLSDLRESGSIEQDADKVLFMWRPYRDDVDHPQHALTMLEVAKNRNGPIGKVKLGFNASSFQFGEWLGVQEDDRW